MLLLSPHFDDVAFSCAGSLCQHIAAGQRALVVTVFAGPPASDLPLRPIHRSILPQDDVSGSGLHALWQQRRVEDDAAMDVLGCGRLHWEFPDAIFRPGIDRWAQIWGREEADGSGLLLQLAERLLALWQRCGQPVLFAPLGVGSHIDHLLCFAAAKQVAAAGAETWYYEELPYSLRPGVLDQRLAALGEGWRAHDVDVTAHMQKRVAAACCYRSQLAGSFGSAERAAALLCGLAAARSGQRDRFCERLWQHQAASSPRPRRIETP